jgi:hypothetical protein
MHHRQLAKNFVPETCKDLLSKLFHFRRFQTFKVYLLHAHQGKNFCREINEAKQTSQEQTFIFSSK